MTHKQSDIAKIPKGPYCYEFIDGKQKNCPFWFKLKTKPPQCNGYCKLLDIHDEDLPASFALLWDQVKVCDINNDIDDTYEF